MKINTTRFGEIEVEESKCIRMEGAILGFEYLRNFVLFPGEGNTPFWWLQSVQDPTIAFVVINPYIVLPDYRPGIPDGDFTLLEIKHTEDIAVLVIVTIRYNPFRVTANLRAPILVNADNRLAKQVVLEMDDYPIQYDLLDMEENMGKEMPEEYQSRVGWGKLSITGRPATCRE